MSQHASLKIDSVGARHRNVLKRHERVSDLRNSERWGDRDSAFKLPKVKLIKMKVKKAKGGKEEAAEGEAKPAATGAPTAAASAKPAAAKAAAPEKGKAK